MTSSCAAVSLFLRPAENGSLNGRAHISLKRCKNVREIGREYLCRCWIRSTLYVLRTNQEIDRGCDAPGKERVEDKWKMPVSLYINKNHNTFMRLLTFIYDPRLLINNSPDNRGNNPELKQTIIITFAMIDESRLPYVYKLQDLNY